MKFFIKSILVILFCSSCSLAQKTPLEYLGVQYYKNQIKVPDYKKQSFHKTEVNFGLLHSQNKFIFVKSFIEEINSNSQLAAQQITYLKHSSLDPSNNAAQLNHFQIRDYYKIHFSSDTIHISTYSKSGFIFALAAIDYELSKDTPFMIKSIENWPDIDQRGIQVNLKGMDPDIIKKLTYRVLRGHYNYVLFSIHNSVAFTAIKPYLREDAMSKSEFKMLVDHYRMHDLEVIPNFAFLSHQERAFITHDKIGNLLYNRKTINPYSKEAQAIVKNVIDETIKLVQPKAIHIGHDEVVGHNQKQIDQYGPILDSKAFLHSVRYIHSYLKKKKVKTWIWGDMFLYAPDFPEMHSGALNGPKSYRNLVDSIPKDIFICDWHYKHYKGKLKTKLDFSSIDFFLARNLDVAGATYNQKEFTQQFANYCAVKANTKFNSMLATTWHKLLKGTTKATKSNDQLKEFDTILQGSANYFWNATSLH